MARLVHEWTRRGGGDACVWMEMDGMSFTDSFIKG
jgi:hypothetical protein